MKKVKCGTYRELGYTPIASLFKSESQSRTPIVSENVILLRKTRGHG